MKRNKKVNLTSIFVASIIVVCVMVFVFGGGAIKLNEVESIEIIATDENIKLLISDSNDIRDIGAILNKRAANDSPSCPFGYVQIYIKQKDSTISIYPATDSCHIFKLSNKYFHVSDEEWEKLMQILKKYDIDRSLFESGKGI